MTSMFKKAAVGVALAASTVATVAPAEAQYRRDYRGYRHRGDNGAGAAVLAGVIGLGLGAAIASSNRNRYYDRGYYDNGYYYNRPRVIYRQRYFAPPPRAYYRDRYYRGGPRGYYGGGYGRGYYGY